MTVTKKCNAYVFVFFLGGGGCDMRANDMIASYRRQFVKKIRVQFFL